ncbi:MAG: phytanoyl-CoA dioxygenase family protein [Robiginitomaculum sp.]|nr:phytanoyl-CoA dioxygenase family protein [Robiginitomaculum sp.]
MKAPFLSPLQQKSFQQDGYIVIPNFKSRKDINTLKSRAHEIVSAHDFEYNNVFFASGASATDTQNTFQNYFLDSANKIKCFFEQHAFNEQGELNQPLELSINKVGHALHDLDPVFDAFSRGGKLADLATCLGVKHPKIWQSMYIFKQANIGGQVDWYQDASFFQTSPSSVITFWFALDDATQENGCLWVERGGHNSPLRGIFMRQDENTHMQEIDKTPWPSLENAEPLEVKAGTLVCFHGHLPHFSAPNTSQNPRHAYTLHVTDGLALYSHKNWIQRDDNFPVRGF